MFSYKTTNHNKLNSSNPRSELQSIKQNKPNYLFIQKSWEWRKDICDCSYLNSTDQTARYHGIRQASPVIKRKHNRMKNIEKGSIWEKINKLRQEKEIKKRVFCMNGDRIFKPWTSNFGYLTPISNLEPGNWSIKDQNLNERSRSGESETNPKSRQAGLKTR